MNNNEGSTNNQELSVPGFGVAGMVICPKMSLTHPAPCCKSGCEHWVELECGGKQVGRCADSWNVVLLTEIRMEIEKLKQTILEKK